MEVYKVGRKPEGALGPVNKAISFKKEHSEDVVGMDIACNGRFIISCSGKTDLLVWDLKGNILTRVDTYLMSTYSARISPCGRFIVASGFTSDIKVWEVLFTKTGEFSQVSRVFELSGHSSGVYDFGISSDSSSMASVSKDSSWKLYNTKVEYKNGEDPHLVTTGKYKSNHHVSRIALSPNGQVVVISIGSSLAFYDSSTGQLDKEIENIFPGEISCIKFDASGRYLLCAGLKHIHVLHNGTGYRTTIRVLRAGLVSSKLSSTQRERMEKQIEEAEIALRNIKEEP